MRNTTGIFRPPRPRWTARSAGLLAAGALTAGVLVAAAGAGGLNPAAADAAPAPAGDLGPRLDHNRERSRQAERSRHGRLLHRPEHRPDGGRRPNPDLPDHAGIRRRDHRFLGDGPLHAARRPARAGDGVPLQPQDRRRPGLPAPADRRLGHGRHRAVHLRRPARRADRLRPAALQHRSRPGADPAAAARGQGPQSPAADHRLAVEPARVDEDLRQPDRRPAHRHPPDLPGLRPVPAEVHRGVPGQRSRRQRDHRAERAAEPHPRQLPGHRPAVLAGGRGHRGPRADAAGRRTCQPRSSPTTTTGRSTPTTSPPPRPTRSATSTTIRRTSWPPRRPNGSPVSRSTATTATPAR